MPSILQIFDSKVATVDLTLVDQLSLPARDERRVPIPDAYRSGLAGEWLSSDDKLQGTIWRHQALALEAFAADRNVVLSTGTASGKSLVFQAAAIRTLQEDAEARVLVLYPLKALAADQRVSWCRALSSAGVPEDRIAILTGDVRGSDQRKKLLDTARILIATPDIVHSWLMRELASLSSKRFLAKLDLLIIDEAHTYEAVFGSNAAFLFRRLQAAARICRVKERKSRGFFVIATSATIANPREHLQALTGLEFVAIDENQDGSPQHERTLCHLSCDNENTLSIVSDLQRALIDSSDAGSFITFLDSRQGVERLATQTDHGLINPYRGGYESEDRAVIERSLRAGKLRGVVATSALELGIDIPHFAVGLNLGLPSSRKAFRQRIGRVGRTTPGVFAVIAEHNEFRRYGSSLTDYYGGSIEPSHLYLENRFVQFAHARCLADELDMIGKIVGRAALPGSIDWPSDFKDIFEFAKIRGGRVRPREFDHIAGIGGDAPHLSYPLRNVGETSFKIVAGRGPSPELGTITHQQAIRESYPGAVYLHMGQRWRVHEWRITPGERSIRVSKWKSPFLTSPVIRTFVKLSAEREGIVGGNYREGPHGFLAECHLQITDRVEGYKEQGDRKLYRDLRQENPLLTHKTRDFRTTGVILKIELDWMKEGANKLQLAHTLRALIAHEYSILPQDLGSVATNISMEKDGRRHPVGDAIVIYDATYGSLRLTEPVFTDLDVLISRLERSMEWSSDGEALVPGQIASDFRNWYESLGSVDSENFVGIGNESAQMTEDGFIYVLASGSIVARRGEQGVLQDIEILEPVILTLDGSTPQLCYRYKTETNKGGTRMIPDQQIELVGDEYSYQLWDPQTGAYIDEGDN